MDVVQGMTLSTVQEDDRVAIQLEGELDFASAQRLIDAIEDCLVEQTKVCLINCQQVTFIDTECLKSIIYMKHNLATRGIDLCIEQCSTQVSRVIKMLGLTEFFQMPLTLQSEQAASSTPRSFI
ncbi:MAG: STAS domain-containing protein [Armatimonadota bacterium]|nr:STAS domain-containing protein [bacterium]